MRAFRWVTRVAAPRVLFKKWVRGVGGVVLVSGSVVGVSPSAAVAQAPDEAWRTIRTEHFRVTFPERLESLGRRAALRSEEAYDDLEELFIEPPDGVIDVLVTDHTDRSNGSAQIFPTNRITVFARPPADALALGHMDEWMELVITHELAHIVHLDHVENPIGRVARAVFGRVSSDWPFFPEVGTPRWVIEGLATWYESRLTDAGRVDGTFQEMQLRTALLEGRFEDIDQASGNSPLWPGGNRRYAYGSLFFAFLLEEHGEDKMADFADAIAGQWIPYRLDAAGRDAFGVSLTDEWARWEVLLRERLEGLDERLSSFGPISEPERLTDGARWAEHPRVSPDGGLLAYNRSDGRSDIQIEVLDLASGERRKFGRTNGLSTFSWLPDGRMLVSQLELRGPYRAYGDLYLFDRSGAQDRLTHAARLTQPSAGPGERAVAVQEGGGSNALVYVDLSDGSVTPLVQSVPDVHWAYPRLSPDGRWIAATRWTPGANHDVVVLDAADGRVVDRVTQDRAVDLAPEWAPEGDWLVWGSDRTGIPNVYGAPVDRSTGGVGDPLMLTNVRTGAAYPSVDPGGDWLYFAGHHVDGWEVERIPFSPEESPAAPMVAERFDASGRGARPSAPGEPSPADAPLRGYSPFPTLWPSYWEISYEDPLDVPGIATDDFVLRRRELLGFGVGLQTSGRDLVGRHSYAVEARVTTERTAFEGGASYSWAGLGNPIFSLTGTQAYFSGGQQLAGTNPDTLFTLERERSLEAAVTVLAPTWRRGLSFTAAAGVVWERRELLDERLDRSTQYALDRPNSRLSDLSLSVTYNSSRSHSFQMGSAKGVSLFVLGRTRRELTLPDSLDGVIGPDRSFDEVIGRVRGAIPLGGGGFASHVLALQGTAGIGSGPGAGVFHYGVGGASGSQETLTGLELFGGSFIFFPVRGYRTFSRFGRYAWSATAEYRFPLLLVNEGFAAWPIHLDRAIGSLFFDAGNAWGPDVAPSGFPNTLQIALASVGAEVTTEFLGLYDTRLRLRTGVAFPLVQSDGPTVYLRVGLPF